jgi:hypothetical protein
VRVRLHVSQDGGSRRGYETYGRSLQALARDFVVYSISRNLDVARSALLEDISEDLVECVGPGGIGDWRDRVEECLRNRQWLRHGGEGSKGGWGV